MFSSRIPLRTLETLCRSLATMLDAGVPILKALRTVSKKTGDAKCRRILHRVTEAVEQGYDIATACRDRGGYFPELFCDLLAVSEQSGAMPEVLAHLADHYENLIKTRRNFLTAIAWPVIQYVAANLVIAGVIYLLGWIASMNPNSKPTDTLGLGLMGATGAFLWLAVSFGSVGGIIFGYLFLKRGFEQHRILDSLLLMIPVVGRCMRAFAIARFSWAFYLTQNSGMPIVPSLAASLKATGNGAFQAMTGRVTSLVKEGEELSVALEQTGLFPEEYLHMVQVAESSGTVPEALHRLSPQFEDSARRALAMLVTGISWLVWLCVAGLIIFVVFSVVMQYVTLLNNLANGRF